MKLLLVLACLLLPAAWAAEPLRIGVSGDYPPFNYIENGHLAGFDPEIAMALCQAMQADCQLVQQPWDQAIPALQQGKIDAFASSMAITKERQALVDFTRPYYNSPVRFVVRQDQPIDVATPAALQGKVLAAQDNTIYADYIRATYVPAGARLLLVDTEEDIWRAVSDGRADAAIGDVVANLEVFKAPYGRGLMETGAEILDTHYLGIGAGIALRKGNDPLRARLDQALQTIHQSGQYAAIRSRYFNFDVWADD